LLLFFSSYLFPELGIMFPLRKKSNSAFTLCLSSMAKFGILIQSQVDGDIQEFILMCAPIDRNSLFFFIFANIHLF
jgi:hypothetical protein